MNRSQPVGQLGGGGWQTSSSDPRPGETRKGKKKREQVLNAMLEMFIENIEYAVIENVVQSCDYSVEHATEALLSMCSDVSSTSSPKETTSVKTMYPTATTGLEVIRDAYGGQDCDSDVNFEDGTEERVENSWQEVSSHRGSSSRMYRIKCPDLPPQSTRESASKPKALVKPGTPARKSIASIPPQKTLLNPKVQPFKSAHVKAIENINYYIIEGMKLLILMRGCPGSGKSYFANNLILSIGGKTEEHVYSTDDFFSRDGSYVFRIEKLQEAHQWNQQRVLEALRKGCSPIVVDNTHTMMWEMNAYAVMGVTNGYALEILEPPTPWFFNEAELARRNRHGVPRDKIRTMLDRYEKNVTADRLIKAAGLSYFPRNLPPQPAARPTGKIRDLHIDTVDWHPFSYQIPRCQGAITNEQTIISGSNPNYSSFIPSQPISALDTTAYEAASCSEIANGDLSNQNFPNMITEPVVDVNGRVDAELQAEPRNSVSEFFSKFKKEKRTISEVKSGNEMVSHVSSEDVAQVCSAFQSLTTKDIENVELLNDSSDDSNPEEVLEVNLPKARCIHSQTECDSQLEGSDSTITETSEEEKWSTTDDETSEMLSSSPEESQAVLKEVGSDKIIQDDGMLLQSSKIVSTSGMSDNIGTSSSNSTLLTPLEKDCTDATEESFTSLGDEDTRSVDFVMVSSVPTNPSNRTGVPLDKSQIIDEAVSNKTEEATFEKDYSWVMGSSWIESKPSPPEDSLTSSMVLLKENPAVLVPKEPREKKRCSSVSRELPHLESFEEGSLEVGIPHEPSEWTISDDAAASWQTIEKNQEEFYGTWQEKKSDLAAPLAQRPLSDKNGKSHCSVQDASTITHHSDFSILSNLPLSGLDSNIKLLNAFDRSINEGTVQLESKIPLKFMLDKGTTIDNDLPIIIETKGSRDKLAELIRLFPNEAAESLKELLENCQWDINWASNCLLDTNCDGLGTSAFQGNLNVEDLVMSVPCDIEEKEDECQNQDALPDTPIYHETLKKNDSEASKASALALKKHIEESIVMSEESYSPFVLQIKNFRRGLNMQSPNLPVGESIEIPSPTPSSISSGSRILSQESTDDEKRTKSEEDETEEDEEEDEEESLEFILSQDFIQQLMDKFGPSGSWHPPSMSPVVKFPMSLARQIHYHVVMSQQQHEDTEYAALQHMCQQDEKIARQMYEDMEQQSKVSSPTTPQLREIMDMEMAQAIYRADIESLHRNSEDTIASVLAKRLLQDMFPKIDNKVLQDVLRAHNNSFEETVNVLQQSISNSDLAFSAGGLAQRDKELLEKVKRSSMRGARETLSAFDTDLENPETAMADAQGYREEAARLLEERRECYRKAQDSFQRGQRSVAAYYSQLGNVLKKQIDQANARAASAFVSAHALEKSPYTLDLHYLHVAEAVQVLDMFLDHHITKLYGPGQGQEWLYIITGRGARSTNGLSRIKPAVVRRLTDRKLEFKTENPGLLRVSVTRNTPLACKAER